MSQCTPYVAALSRPHSVRVLRVRHTGVKHSLLEADCPCEDRISVEGTVWGVLLDLWRPRLERRYDIKKAAHDLIFTTFRRQ